MAGVAWLRAGIGVNRPGGMYTCSSALMISDVAAQLAAKLMVHRVVGHGWRCHRDAVQFSNSNGLPLRAGQSRMFGWRYGWMI